MLDKKFFRELASNVVNMYRNHTFDKGLDVKGKKFKPYSKEYGEAKRAKKFKRQANQFANKTSPVLTGDLFRDFKVKKIRSDGFSFGTVSHGEKVIGLKKLGRVIADFDNFPDHIEDFIEKEAEEYVMKQMKKNFKDERYDV